MTTDGPSHSHGTGAHHPHHEHAQGATSPAASAPGEPVFDEQWWEQHYQAAAVESPEQPGTHLVAELAGLTPGTALDAGCGTGAGARWLARQGWDVTAVDVSPTAIERARALAAGRELPGRVAWSVADLTVGPISGQYDLVVSQYVHPNLPFGEFVTRLAGAVTAGGTLLIVGHDPADGHSAAHSPRPASIGAEAVTGALPAKDWQVVVAETRTRQVPRGDAELTMVDLVVRAQRRSAA